MIYSNILSFNSTPKNESKGNSFASKRILRHDELISYGLEEYYKCLKLHEIAIHAFFPLC